MRRISFWLCMILSCLSPAEIVESKNWIVGKDAHGIMKRLNLLTSLPEDNLPEGTVVIAVDMGSAFVNVYVLGAVKSDAKVLANALQAGVGQDSLIQYSQEGDFAAAVWQDSRAKWFSNQSTSEVNIEPIRQAILNKGLDCRVIFRAMKHCSISPALTVSASIPAGTYHLIQADQAVPKVSVSARTSSWPAIAALIVFVAPGLLTGLGLLLAGAIGRNTAVPKDQRKKAFSRVARVFTFGPIGLALPFAFWAIFTRQFLPLCDLWFGTRSIGPFLPMVFLPLLIVLPCAMHIANTEMRLFGDKDFDDPTYSAPKTENLVGPPKWSKWLSAAAILACFAVYMGLRSLPVKQYGEWPRFASIFVLFAPMFRSSWLGLITKLRSGAVSGTGMTSELSA
ncbi:MAG: hypothetical protein ABL962_20050, partial [Fimbriimonadaceae bacterium]